MGKNKSRIIDVNTILQAGIVPNRDELEHSLLGKRIPTRAIDDGIYVDSRRALRIIDEQNAISRFKWYNLPAGINGEELERFLYYKGQLAFFYIPQLDQFYFMPYALNGTIDFYGRYNTITPVPMSNGTSEDKNRTAQADILSHMKLQCQYGIPLNYKPEMMLNSAVLLHDHCKQMSETIIPRQQLNEGFCALEAELLAYMRTNAIAGCGVRGLRVGNDDEQAQVMIGNKSVVDSAKKGDIWTPIIGSMEFQDLMEKNGNAMNDYFEAMQAVDNLRLSTYGLGEGQLFEKKAHMLQTEAESNQSNVGVVLSSDLAIRQNFCNIVNSIWGLGIWCEPNEAYAGEDLNGDGNDYSDDTDGSQTAVEGGSND